MSFEEQNGRTSNVENIYSEEEFYRPRGMLTRDQRTVLTRKESNRTRSNLQTPFVRYLSKGTCCFEKQFLNMCQIPKSNSSSQTVDDLNSECTASVGLNTSKSQCVLNLGSIYYSVRQRKDNSIRSYHRKQYRCSRHGRSIISKLFEVVAALCFLGFALECSGAPARTMQRRNTPRWFNPCTSERTSDPAQEFSPRPVIDILNPILSTANIALAQATSFKDDFVMKTFRTGFNSHHEAWQDYGYKWLPTRDNIPKSLGEELSKEHLQKLEDRLDDTLRNTSQYLQRFAVGFEEVLHDEYVSRSMDSDKGLFVSEFEQVEGQLHSVLCELEKAMYFRNIERHTNIERNIMTSDYRGLLGNQSHRKLRDWVIYRDYINALEYIVHVFKHLVEINKDEDPSDNTD